MSTAETNNVKLARHKTTKSRGKVEDIKFRLSEAGELQLQRNGDSDQAGLNCKARRRTLLSPYINGILGAHDSR